LKVAVMSAFVAVPPAPQSPVNATVTAGDWWPEIDCGAMREALRLGDAVTHVRLVEAVRGAIITVQAELRDWTATQRAAGVETLSAVAPDEMIDGFTRLELLWIRAVRFHAAAELLEGHRDTSATNEMIVRADAELCTAGDYRKLATQAVRDILGVPRTTVELI
jgi:hypothetical protein